MGRSADLRRDVLPRSPETAIRGIGRYSIAERVQTGVLRGFVNSVIAHVVQRDVVARPKAVLDFEIPPWYWGAMIRRAAFVKDGTTKSGFEAWICARVWPAAKPCVGTTCWHPPLTTPDCQQSRETAEPFPPGTDCSGELFSRLSAIVAGKASVNKPEAAADHGCCDRSRTDPREADPGPPADLSVVRQRLVQAGMDGIQLYGVSTE